MQDKENVSDAKATAPRRKTCAKGIFAVDRTTWHGVCALGLNAAVAYLVIACGTGLDMITSKWSAKSMRTYTGMRFNSSKDAIEALRSGGFLTVEGTQEKPRYRLTLFDDPAFEADWIWLPNTIITGAAGEASPLRLIRQTNQTAPLKLFIDLYHRHDLFNSGGVDCRGPVGMSIEYIRDCIGQHGIFNLYCFDRGKHTFSDKESWLVLYELGLLEIVEHVVDAPDGEIIYPLPFYFTGEALEQELTRAVSDAGQRMAAAWQRDKKSLIIPVERRIRDVSVIPVIRMKYRPQTALTAKWLQGLDDLRSEIERYDAMAR